MHNFKLVFKAIITITIFFIALSYFVIWLYSLSIFVSIGSLIFFVFTYLILDISPILIRKMDPEMMKLIEEYNSGFANKQPGR